MIENRKNYRLDVDKIKTLKDVKNVLDNLHLIGYYDADDPNDENYYLSEYFTIPQERQGLTFSTPRKSIEELKQELDEKFDALIKTTKEKFECSNYFAGKRYNQKFDSIIENFEYAREHGHFIPKVTIGTLDGSYLVSTGSGDLNWITSSITPSFVIKQGDKHDGYYTIGDGYYRFYMKEKPNMIFRWFVHKLMGFKWIDEKDT